MRPKYDLDKIKYATDAPTFEKAVALYESGRVTQLEESIRAYSAVVIGTKPYRVSVEGRSYGYGYCECYLGKKDILCKHMVALAIAAVKEGELLTDEDKQLATQPACNGKSGTLTQEELSGAKKSITAAMRYIKAYEGPSRIWFAYQSSLSEGCSRLTKIVSDLPVGEQTAKLLVDLLLRLDDKLCSGGVDDSDGTVGSFIEDTVEVLKEYVKRDPACAKALKKLEGKETCFGWEKPLVEFIKNG
ncbi:MAG: SWIM zinc finger family protein [Nitrospirota bacterium]